MDQEKKIGTPEAGETPIQADTAKTPVPGIIYPRCPHCLQPNTGDPLKMWRLRYDFPDGVVAEVLFCGDCRAVISALLVGYTPTARAK